MDAGVAAPVHAADCAAAWVHGVRTGVAESAAPVCRPLVALLACAGAVAC